MRTLRAVFGVHGPITLAGAFVLTVFPTAIPSAVGITITRPDYLLVYLVAAAEFAVAVLSFGATRITDWAALQLIVTTFVVLHLVSGVLDSSIWGDRSQRHADVNTVFVSRSSQCSSSYGGVSRPHQTPGTNR